MSELAPAASVDEEGITLEVQEDVVVDVSFDGRRIWSFWTLRDTEQDETGRRRVAWPRRLQGYLDGTARVAVVEHVSGRLLHDAELSFGTADTRIAVVGRHGEPLSFDKSGSLVATFDGRDPGPLLDSIEALVDVLRELGIEAFLAYGTLLGAVREGRVLAHDSDADLGYVSRRTTPVDVVLESFRIQRGLEAHGYETYRYSGAALRVTVEERDGVRRGLDVFGGFLDGGRLYLMGEVGVEFDPSWIFPLGTCTLDGRTLPAPAAPERLLEAMYGPEWKVPDPAFKFTTPARTTEKLNQWFRGLVVHRLAWERSYGGGQARLAGRRPGSELARHLHEETPEPTHVLDIGAGAAADALFLARQGRRVTAYDYVPWAAGAATWRAERKDLALESRRLNLTELRSILGEGARLAQHPEPRAILARHVLDATDSLGRDNLARFASMVLRGTGGRLYAEFWSGGGEDAEDAEEWVRPLPLEDAVELVTKHGGSILLATERAADRPPYSIGRLVAQWG